MLNSRVLSTAVAIILIGPFGAFLEPIFTPWANKWIAPAFSAPREGPPPSSLASRQWNEAQARLEVYEAAQRFIDPRIFEARDPDYAANQVTLGKGVTHTAHRWVVPSGEGFYWVRLDNGPTLYYSSRGKLKAVELIQQSGLLTKSYKYLIGDYAERLGLKSGQLLFATLQIGPNEQFVFETTGQLQAHWQNGICFKADGSRCTLWGQ